MYPRQSPTTHTEQLGDEASVYDWARAQVHALNPTAARVWRQCDGRRALTRSPRPCAGDGDPRGRCGRRPDTQATRAPAPAGAAGRVARRSTGNDPALAARSWRGGGDAAGDLRSWRRLPWKRSRRGAGAPTLTSVSPNQGIRGTTVAVTLTGTIRRRRHDGDRRGGGVTVTNVVVGSSDVADRQLRARSGRCRRCPHGDGHDGRRDERRANLHDQSPAPGAPTLTSVAPNQGSRAAGGGHADGHQFRRRRHDGGRQRQRRDGQQRLVGSRTSLTANFVLDAAAAAGPRTVTVTTAGGTSGGQTFTSICRRRARRR